MSSETTHSQEDKSRPSAAEVAARVEPEIIWEDESLAVVFKPASWLTVPGLPGTTTASDPCVQAWLSRRWHTSEASQAFVGTVHRLDRPVSGVMVWARNPRAARRLSEQFAKGKVIKQYWAVVEGGPPANSGTWEDWLIVNRQNGKNVVGRCSPGAPGGQTARTDWQKLQSIGLKEGLGWLSLWPKTGRMHQLRVQSAGRGWPIIGDLGYGKPSELWPHDWKMALHARSLTFTHPETQQRFLVESAVEQHWRSLGDDASWFRPEGRFSIRKF
ncbi:MAG: RluA family pseudouridine synthase [bacterium]